MELSPSDVEILTGIRAIIESGWTQGVWARFRNGKPCHDAVVRIPDDGSTGS